MTLLLENLVAILIVGSWLGLLLGGIYAASKGRRLIALVLLVIAVFAFLLCTDWGASQAARDNARKAQCTNNITQFGQALLQYEMMHGHFPPVFTTDADGNRLQSWRVFLLPHFGQQELHSQIHLKEPWDNPHNREVTKQQLELYRCPMDKGEGKYDTSYVAVVGADFLWDSAHANATSDIKDDPGDTIMLVEMEHSGIRWAEPRDLDLEHLPAGITQENLLKSLSHHAPGGFNAVFADGHVEFIPATIPWEQFKALLTIAGGEKVDREKWGK